MTEGMGAISDRARENLAPSDIMIVTTRRRLLDAARALAEEGAPPPGLDDPAIAGTARAGDLIAPERKNWLDAYEEEFGRAVHPLAQAAE